MPRFEVFIPAQDEVGFDMTFRVEADNWMAALKTGMEKLGKQGPGGNIFCDIKEDNSIHVTDPATGKVFRIKETDEEPAQATEVTPAPDFDEDGATQPGVVVPHFEESEAGTDPDVLLPRKQGTDPQHPAAGGTTEPQMPAVREPPAREPPVREPPVREPPAREPPAREPPVREPPVRSKPTPAPRRRDEEPTLVPAPEPAPERTVREPARSIPPTPAPVARPRPRGGDTAVRHIEEIKAEHARRPSGPIGRKVKPRSQEEIEETLADLFQRASDIFQYAKSDEAMSFLLDLAMEKVACDSGSVYRAAISGHDLRFAAVRGPKADDLLRMNIRVPVGKGLAGVCVQEGVGIAISDAHRDPRFFKEISQKLGYETRSVITVPIQLEGQVMGAVQLMNRKQGTSFNENDLAVLSYLARQAADYLHRTGEVVV